MGCTSCFPAKADLRTWPWWKKKLLKHFLPLGFLLALIIALAWPWPGDTISSWQAGDYKIVPTINICTIFVISGLTLKTDDMVAALKQPLGLIYGLVAILGITPMLGFAAVKIPFDVDAFSTGLAIFCTVPTTLSSGVALVTAAYGNGALALLLTVASNLIGIVTVPFLLRFMLSGSGDDVELDAVKLLIKLLLTILVPITIGKLLQSFAKPVRDYVNKHKTLFKLLNNGSLVLIVWQTLSQAQENITDTKFAEICLLILAGIAVHIIYLAINFGACCLLKLPPRELKAVLIMASQKTLPVSVTIIAYLDPGTFGSLGLLTIPCIVGHMVQLFMDAFLVSRMAAKEEERIEREEGGESANTEAVLNRSSGTDGSGSGSEHSVQSAGATYAGDMELGKVEPQRRSREGSLVSSHQMSHTLDRHS